MLARYSNLSTGAMTNRLDRLEAAGLVRRLADPDDRRSIQVELTAEGRKAWEATVDAQARKEYGEAGAFMRELALPGTDPEGVAVANGSGKVYVADAKGRRLLRVGSRLDKIEAVASLPAGAGGVDATGADAATAGVVATGVAATGVTTTGVVT